MLRLEPNEGLNVDNDFSLANNILKCCCCFSVFFVDFYMLINHLFKKMFTGRFRLMIPLKVKSIFINLYLKLANVIKFSM